MARTIGIRIPQHYQLGLAKIISLSESSVDELITLLENTPITLDLKKSIDSISTKVTTLSTEDAKSVIETTNSLYELRNQISPQLQPEEFIETIVGAMNESENESLKLSDENLEKFKQKLSALLSVKSLSIRTKAINLILDHENILHHTNLVTDIRPVFGSKVEESPIGAVLVHTLKLEYKQNDEIKNFYVALDDEDIITLINSLKRTQTKSESLKKLLDKAGLSNFEIE